MNAPYRSGEFPIPNLLLPLATDSCVTAATVFEDTLYLFSVQHNLQLNQFIGIGVTKFPLFDAKGQSIGIEKGAALYAPNWSTNQLAIPDFEFGDPGLPGDNQDYIYGAAVPLGTSLYYLWPEASLDRDVCATVYSPSTGWQNPVTLRTSDQSGAALLIESVSASSFGDDTLIVTAHIPGSPSGDLFVGAFNVNDIDLGTGTWKARSECNLGVAYIGKYSILTADWFPAVDNNGDQLFYLCVAYAIFGGSPFFDKNLPTNLWLMPIAADGTIESGEATSWTLSDLNPFIMRDPPGRLRTYNITAVENSEPVNALSVGTFSTSATPNPPTSSLPLPYVAGEQLSTGVVFVPRGTYFTDTANGATVSYQQGTRSYTGTSYPVYEWTFYGRLCQVNLYGQAQEFPNCLSLVPTPKYSGTVIVSGIIDGPIPIPDANIADCQGTQSDFGDITYSTTDKTAITHQVSNSFTVGIKTQGEMTKGWGPAWDISVSGGMSFVNSSGTTTSLSTDKTQTATLDTSTTPPNQQILPGGTVFCSDVGIKVSTYLFVDPDGSVAVDGFAGTGVAPMFMTTSAVYSDGSQYGYLPYAVTPGDLHSYTPDEWDATMATLGFGQNYFESVIQANGFNFGDQNYLEATWSPTAKQQSAFKLVTDNFTETSWELDASVYIGCSGGEGASIFGFGAEAFFKFLVGGTYSHEAQTTTDDQKGWGIGLPESFGPPASDDPNAIGGYTFRIYFLPPPTTDITVGPNSWGANAWTLELIECLQKQAPPTRKLPFTPIDPNAIDPNGAAWKICYVVTDYVSVDGKTTYHYAGPDSRPRA